jgi:hypothetical protein
MRRQEKTPMRLVAKNLLVIAWVWVVCKFGVEWNKSFQHQTRRQQEASFLVKTMCSKDTENLAREFARCEEARITIADGKQGVWLRAFERTFRAVAVDVVKETGALSITTISHALLIIIGLGLVGAVSTFVTKKLRDADELDVLSPLAISRLQTAVDVGPIGYIDMKKLN